MHVHVARLSAIVTPLRGTTPGGSRASTRKRRSRADHEWSHQHILSSRNLLSSPFTSLPKLYPSQSSTLKSPRLIAHFLTSSGRAPSKPVPILGTYNREPKFLTKICSLLYSPNMTFISIIHVRRYIFSTTTNFKKPSLLEKSK